MEIKQKLYKLPDHMLIDVFEEACSRHRFDMTKLLQVYGANIHAKRDGAFKGACSSGHLEIAKWLVELGVDIHVGFEYGLRLAYTKGHYSEYLQSVD